MLYFSPGMSMRRDFGSGQCPHCLKPFTKANKNQITGSDKCRLAQQRVTDQAWNARRKRATR